MTSRRCNPRLVKIHRSYTVEEVAKLFGMHKNSVRAWIKRGLPTSDNRRPTLILGRDLATFLQAQRTKNKRACKPGEMYCVRCRLPKKPAGDMVEYQPITEKIGNLIALCPDCNAIMNRRICLARLPQIRGQMEITFPQALPHISESNHATVNCYLEY